MVAIVCVWLGIFFLGTHIYVDLARSHAGDTAKGRQIAQSYVRLVAEQALGTFDRVDLVLEQAVKLPTPRDMANVRALGDGRRSLIEADLKALQARAEGIVSMSMTDESGYVFANTVDQPPGGFLGDRGYFLALKTGAAPEPAVSEVIFGRISNKWGVQVARKIRKPDGGFGGMVVANVGMSTYLRDFYESLNLPPGSVLSLRDADHKIIVRFPELAGMYGQVVPPVEVPPRLGPAEDEAYYVRASPVDGQVRGVATKKLRRYGIYAAVGILENETRAAWKQSLRQSALLFTLAFIAAVISTIISYRKHKLDRQIATYTRELGRTSAELSGTNTALTTEIAVRLRAEQALRDKELLFQVLVQQIPHGIALLGQDGGIGYINPAFTRILGYTIEDIPDVTTWWSRAYPDPDYRRMVMETWQQTVVEPDSFERVSRVFAVCHRDGTSRFIQFFVVPLPDGRIMVTLDDITETRQAALQAERAVEAERQLMREQRNFVGMVSHEFRMPLAIIQGASQLLAIYNRANDDAMDEIGKVARAVQRMTDLIDVCLADDRLESSVITLSLAEVELRSALAELCEDKRPLAGNRPILIHCEHPTRIKADNTLLRIAFSNLIDNALKFSPPDAAVEIDVAVAADSVTVSIADHGPGIRPEDQDRIFEKFYRSTQTDRIRGAGLGLFIVKRIVELHHGAIAIDSRPGAGTTLAVTLPLDPAA